MFTAPSRPGFEDYACSRARKRRPMGIRQDTTEGHGRGPHPIIQDRKFAVHPAGDDVFRAARRALFCGSGRCPRLESQPNVRATSGNARAQPLRALPLCDQRRSPGAPSLGAATRALPCNMLGLAIFSGSSCPCGRSHGATSPGAALSGSSLQGPAAISQLRHWAQPLRRCPTSVPRQEM